MLRMAKLTDYGIVLLTHFAHRAGGGSDVEPQNARELAEATQLPLPTVGKLLKILKDRQLLASHRGIKGGYSLARRPSEITIAEIVSALEGPIAVTECNTARPGLCEHETGCPTRGNWQLINKVILEALQKVSLADMARPLSPSRWTSLPKYPAGQTASKAADAARGASRGDAVPSHPRSV